MFMCQLCFLWQFLGGAKSLSVNVSYFNFTSWAQNPEVWTTWAPVDGRIWNLAHIFYLNYFTGDHGEILWICITLAFFPLINTLKIIEVNQIGFTLCIFPDLRMRSLIFLLILANFFIIGHCKLSGPNFCIFNLPSVHIISDIQVSDRIGCIGNRVGNVFGSWKSSTDGQMPNRFVNNLHREQR